MGTFFSEGRRPFSSSAYIPPVAAALFVLHLYFSFPGIMTWDSLGQYDQALTGKFNDWHPPIMAVAMRFLLPVSRWGSGLLVVHLVLYWYALALIALTMRELRSVRLKYAVLAIGLIPSTWLLSSYVHKDVGMAVAFLAAFAIVFRQRATGRELRWWHIAAFLALAGYGTLVRTNAMFALPPLLAYAFAPRWFANPLRLAGLFVVTIPIVIGASAVFNHKIIGASSTNVRSSLYVFDIAGISHFSRDAGVFPAQPKPSLSDVDRCYTPRLWDPLSAGTCGEALGAGRNRDHFTAGLVARAIIAHPLAYARHRLAHFNAELFGIAPPNDFTWHRSPMFPEMPPTPYEKNINASLAVASNAPILSPLVWLITSLTALCFLVFRPSRILESSLVTGGYFLLASSTVYTLAFGIIGVADIYRYQHYGMAGAFVGILLLASAVLDLKPWGRSMMRCATIACALTITAVWIARLVL